MAKKKSNSAIRTEKDKKVSRLNRAIYTAVDPTYGYPEGMAVAAAALRSAASLFNPDKMGYEVTDSVADAAWRKRLGLSYDDKFLIENEDGTYRLPKELEMEIPTDTTRLKRRIANNEKLVNSSGIMGDDWRLVKGMLDLDKETLESLRKTYKTGEPVVISEYSNNSRKLAKDGQIIEGAGSYKSPLNVLQNYTIQYDPSSNSMLYRDVYDFNDFESVVPGEAFNIEGSIPLKAYGGYKYSWGGDLLKSLDLKNVFSGSAIGNALKGAAGGIGQAIGGIADGAISGGLESGAGKAITGITGTLGGALSKVNPILGGAVSAVGGIVGGVTNKLFGSKLNKENIAAIEGDISKANAFTSNAGDFDSLTGNFASATSVQGFNRATIGKDGTFSNKVKRNYLSLKQQAEDAETWVANSLANNAENIALTNQQLLEANYNAYGGPIDMKYTGVMSPFGNQFKDGGIFMKANFAKNAKKWKYDDGGILNLIRDSVKDTWDSRKAFFNLFRGLPLMLEYGKPSYGGGSFGGGGASSVPTESPDTYSLVKDTIWVPYRETFNEAFRKADEAGLKEFMFDGMPYTTEKGDNPDNNRAGEERFVEGLIPIERTKRVKNEKAEGGSLFTNGVTIVGNGGTHEQSPLEGVPMGVDNQGIPNRVEEGEVIWNDYVFSNRLRVPKAVRKKYKLRGVTFADAAKQVQKESEERPNDPIAKDTMNAIMSELMQEQEMIRAKRNKNRYAYGGRLANKFADAGPIDTIDTPYSVYTLNPTDDFDYNNWFTVDKNNLGKITKYSDAYKNFYFTADQARAYAANNPNDESLKSYLAKGNKLEDLTDEDVQKGSLDGMHGWLHKARAKAAASEKVTDESQLPTKEEVLKTIKSILPSEDEPLLNRNNTKIKSIPVELEEEHIEEEPLPKGIKPMKDNWMRYAPLFGAGISVLNDWFGGNEPDYSNANMYQRAIEGSNREVRTRPIGNYLAYNPFDTELPLIQSAANAAASRRAIANNAGGNRAAAMAGILASDYNTGLSIGELARNAREYNLAQREKVEAFNRGTNQYNSEMGTKVDMFNAENASRIPGLYANLASMRQGIYDRNRAEKSANLTNFLQGIGDLGREKTDRDMLRWLADLGVLTYSPDGKFKSTKKSKGGKLNRKKRGGFTI